MESTGTPYMSGMGVSNYIIKHGGGLQRQDITKDSCVQLVLDTGGEKMNILEYLKTEMLEEKRTDKDGTIVNLFDRDISLKIESIDDSVTRPISDLSLRTGLADKSRHLQDTTKKRRTIYSDGNRQTRPTRPKNYSCTDCGMSFVSAKDLTRHSVVHTGEKPYSCPYCDQKFTATSSRATHIRSIHEKSQEFLCPECEKPFNQKSNMIKHLKTIHLETVVINCQECGREFNQASALRRHIKIVHKKELPHVCSHCEKKFALAESLKKHMEAIHLKSRAYPCTYCDYASSRADMLKIHIRKVHTKEWSYKCGVCEANGTPWGCILPKELRKHLQTRHPGLHQEVEKVGGKVEEDSNKTEKRKHDDGENDIVTVEERAAELLEQIRHPLEFSVQLEAEVRAKACRAPLSVLASKKDDQEEPLIYTTDHVLLPPTSGTWTYQGVSNPTTQFYRGDGEGRWIETSAIPNEVSTTAETIVVQTGVKGDVGPIRLMYDFPR